MPAPHFSPHRTAPQPCWWCCRYQGLAYGGSAAFCNLPNAPRVRSNPAAGCSGFVREVGADDEPEAPPPWRAAAAETSFGP